MKTLTRSPKPLSKVKTTPTHFTFVDALRLGCIDYPSQCQAGWVDSHGGHCALATVLRVLNQDPVAWSNKGMEETCMYLQGRFPEVSYTTLDNVWRNNDYEKLSRETIADMIQAGQI